MDNDTLIETVGLRRNYGPHEAVRGVSLRVGRGEVHALLGTNGAGKTSTVEVLLGLRRADGGRVRVFGLDPMADRDRIRPRTGAMLQDGGLPGLLTVDEALDLVDLTGRRDVPVGQLSGGEHRRLEPAVLGRPELLFLDEPTTGMDPASRRRMWEGLDGLRRGGTTVLLTTHCLEEAESLADHVTIMAAGRVVTTGRPHDVVAALPARITFCAPALEPPDLPYAVHDPAVHDPGGSDPGGSDRVAYRSRRLQADLAHLLAWAEGSGTALDGLSARPASLEDAFLAIATGTETRR